MLEHVRDLDSGVVVGGVTWLPDGEKKMVGIGSLTSRILCDRHNSALSPLDKMAGQLFQAMRDDARNLAEHGPDGDFPCAFTMINGPLLELWLLKVMWGAIEAGALRLGDTAAYRFRLGVTSSQLAEILWRGAPWPRDWGLYVVTPGRADEKPVWLRSTAIRLVNDGPEILGGCVNFAGIEIMLAFERPPVQSVFRPGALIFGRKGYRNWKMTAMCWPETGHSPVHITSGRGRGEDIYVPPDDWPVGPIDLSRIRI